MLKASSQSNLSRSETGTGTHLTLPFCWRPPVLQHASIPDKVVGLILDALAHLHCSFPVWTTSVERFLNFP